MKPRYEAMKRKWSEKKIKNRNLHVEWDVHLNMPDVYDPSQVRGVDEN